MSAGLLLALGWPESGLPVFLFIAWIPLFLLQQQISNGEGRYKNFTLYLYSLLAFLLWNLLTTWWIWNASPGGAAMAIIANSILMAIVFTTAHVLSQKTGLKSFTAIFITLWIAFEYFHHNWDLTWPWLTLGNGLANMHRWIQWYEYTGTLGGSLWILMVNALIYSGVNGFLFRGKNGWQKKLTRSLFIKIISICLSIIIPCFLSGILYREVYKTTGGLNVVVVQPNIDPYNEKFSGTWQEQLQKMLMLASGKTDSLTDYLVFPETAITENLWENDDDYLNSYSIRLLKHYASIHPGLKIIAGASSANYLGEAEKKPSPTSKKYQNSNEYYEDFNAAYQIGAEGNVQKYHKSKLVPGVEKMPYPAVFGFLENLAIDMGGTTGTLTGQEERTVFTSEAAGAAPAICYESIFGEFITKYIRNGADFICVITNDGWWGDTPGYRQHLVYGRLRAIETRKWVVRSANTGISCFIDEKGNILKATDWWVPAVIKHTISLNNKQTFYVRNGELTGKASYAGTTLLFVYAIILWIKKRNGQQLTS